MTKKLKKRLIRILIAAGLFIALFILDKTGVFDASHYPAPWIGLVLEIALSAAVYLIAGYDVLLKAFRNIFHGQVFDEKFLMMIATFAAYGIQEFVEAPAVMVFYQIGEWFQDYAVGKSRGSITELMKIAPEYANVERDGVLEEVDPEDVAVDDVFVVKPGERVPLDGIVTEGESSVDTSSLTGESVPRTVRTGDEILSGTINQRGVLHVRATRAYEDSTVSKILELVQNASSRKAPVEQFITKFAKIYTPVVTIAAVLLAVIPPLFFGQAWAEWLRRACTFLVISCPCALVISVPLGFFGGIGAASRIGVLVKGSTFLETLSKARIAAFDKTGTLTKGEFKVASLRVFEGESFEEVSSEDIGENARASHILECAAYAEKYSTHPVGEAIRLAYARETDRYEVDAEEIAGQGISAMLDDRVSVLAGNAKLLRSRSIEPVLIESPGTVVYVAENGKLTGAVLIEDSVKEGTKEGLQRIREAGVAKTVMLTGDRTHAATLIAEETGIDEVRAELLPGDKVAAVEALITEAGPKGTVAYVGDGINDAPVLMRADIGIAMGAIGSDAAIEAADIVLMDDDLRKIGKTISIARKTLRIVYENIIFALAVKLVVLILGALGLAPIWLAIFADVGVAVLCVLNSMRCLRSP
ncbi:MAG: heavy metal translocating P-type ATPase [Lachnospiraceae bacterium]|nr:heavy metal translocating P-type ATPase [Lachnospiraceae bacterium]